MKRIEAANILADRSVSSDNPNARSVNLADYFRPGNRIKLLQVEFPSERRPLQGLVRYAVRSGEEWFQPEYGIRIDRDKGFIGRIDEVEGSRRYLRGVANRINRIMYLASLDQWSAN